MSERADYMRRYRAANPSQKVQQVKAARARRKALNILAEGQPQVFRMILNACRKEEGLPPL